MVGSSQIDVVVTVDAAHFSRIPDCSGALVNPRAQTRGHIELSIVRCQEYNGGVKHIVEIRKLPIPERLQLVGEIWDSILDDPALLSISDELARELELRLAAHRADPESSEPWQSVDREIFGTE